jgi:SpoVK/Ycf46/Vps4 family AAA+-type ATPase
MDVDQVTREYQVQREDVLAALSYATRGLSAHAYPSMMCSWRYAMARADQLKALLKSHLDGDEQRFFSVAMQVAASEAKVGHGKLAEELRAMIDEAKRRQGIGQPTLIGRPRGELASLLTIVYPKTRLGDLVLSDSLEQQIRRIIREQRHAAKLLEHGLSPRRKLLLVGPPGTGKTLTASVLGGELGIPLFQVRLDGLITKYMGETAAKLRQVFDATGQTRGVYFFDEFDAIGSHRGLDNDVGEIRRVLNSFLQMIEQDRSHSLIVAATNHPEILDHALFRRFDDVLHYELPNTQQTAVLLRARLAHAATKGISWKRLAERAHGLSHAELSRATEEALKETLIEAREHVTEADISEMIAERQKVAGRLKTNSNE